MVDVYHRIVKWNDLPATLQSHAICWDSQGNLFFVKPKTHFYIFSGLQCLLHNLHAWEEGRCEESVSWCVAIQNVSTYSAVGIKVPCDHKVHSAGLYSFFDIDLTTILVKYLFVSTCAFCILDFRMRW